MTYQQEKVERVAVRYECDRIGCDNAETLVFDDIRPYWSSGNQLGVDNPQPTFDWRQMDPEVGSQLARRDVRLVFCSRECLEGYFAAKVDRIYWQPKAVEKSA